MIINQGKTLLLVILALTLSLLLWPASALADETAGAKQVSRCTGQLYRAKREGVPVYSETSKATQVIKKLKLGEKVCYVGEQNGFAILDWTREYGAADSTSVSAEDSNTITGNKKKQLAYARLTDLWEPRDKPVQPAVTQYGLVGLWNKAKTYFNYMRYGAVPEDGLAPYRPIIGRSEPIDEAEEDTETEKENTTTSSEK